MDRSTVLSAVMSLAVVVALAPAGVGVADGSQADVAIESVEAEPSDPAPGEPFTVTATIANLASSNDTVTVTDVFVRKRGSATEYARVENVGSIATGNALTVPLSVTIEEPGTKRLRVNVVVETGDGDTRSLSYPLLVTVERPDEVLLSIDRAEATVGDRTPVSVTVANGADAPISSVRLSLRGNATVPDGDRITASIPAGVDRNFTYNVTFREPGTRSLEARLTYTTVNGTSWAVTRSSTVAVANASGEGPTGVGGDIRLTGVTTSGQRFVTLQGNAANVGGSNAESVLLTVENTSSVHPASPSGEYFVGAINASQFDTFELSARVERGTDAVPVRIQYIVDGQQRVETVRVDLDSGGGYAPPDDRERRTPVRSVGPPGDGRSGLLTVLPLGLIPLVLVVGLVVGAGVYVRRR